MKFDFKNFKLAPKDKRLLLTIGIVLVLFVTFLVYKKVDAMVVNMQAEVKNLEDVKYDLQEKYRKKTEYETKKGIYKLLYEKIVNNYATGLDQETVIMDLASIEAKTGVWLKQGGFSQTGLIYQFGMVTSSNPSNTGAAVYSTDLLGYSTTTSLSYECSYEQLIAILDLLNHSSNKYKIDSMTMSYSESEELVTGSISLYNYAITGNNRVFPGTTVDSVPIGTENIFESGTHTSNPVDTTYLDKMKSDYDIYVNLNDAASDVDSIIVGMRSDVLGESKVSLNSNSDEKVYIAVNGTAGNYTISYQVGDKTYPVADYEKGEAFIFGDSLDLLIISKARNSEKDSCVAHVSVVNNTDVTLNVGIVSDDAESPRCVFDKTVGDILIYQ